MMIGKNPKHPDLADALFYMGQSYEKSGKKEQAAVFYKKIIAMPGSEEENGPRIKAKRALKALEG
jgi:TolA-binding protein